MKLAQPIDGKDLEQPIRDQNDVAVNFHELVAQGSFDQNQGAVVFRSRVGGVETLRGDELQCPPGGIQDQAGAIFSDVGEHFAVGGRRPHAVVKKPKAKPAAERSSARRLGSASKVT